MLVVFIHGYNVPFEGAAIRAAQLGCDLQIPGVMAFFSWPSQGNFKGYLTDVQSVEFSAPAMIRFLTQLTSQSGAQEVNLIAHSMGNLGLLRALHDIANQASQQSGVTFNEIVLAAPDIDRDVFTTLADAFRKTAKRTTMYVSSEDKALWSAGIVWGNPRAGYVKRPKSPPMLVSGVDTIDVSDMNLSILGHDTFASARAVLTDIYRLLWNGLAPDRRALKQDAAGWWTFPP